MANTYVDYTAVASQTDYNFSFEYLRDEHVKVKVDDVIVTNYTIVTSPVQLIRFNTAPSAGAAIKIYRDSRGDFSPLVDFVNGSVLTESELDESYKHNLFVSQESSEGTGGEQLTKKGLTNYDAEGNKIINLGTPTDATDAANKAYTDQTVDAAIALGGSPAIVSLGGYDVTSSNDTLKQLTAWTADIEGIADGAVNVTATGSTTTRSLADRFGEVINVKDYGAVGDAVITEAAFNATNDYGGQSSSYPYNVHRLSSGTDDRTAFENAFAALQDGDSLYIPAGIYYISGNTSSSGDVLSLDDKKNITIFGDGPSSQIFVFQDVTSYGLALLDIEGCADITIRDLSFNLQGIGYGSRDNANFGFLSLANVEPSGGATNYGSGTVVAGTPSERIVFRNLKIRVNHPGGAYPGDPGSSGLDGATKIQGIYFQGHYQSPSTVGQDYDANLTFINDCKVQDCLFFETQARIIWGRTTKGLQVLRNKFLRCGGQRPAVRMLNLNVDLTVKNNHFECENEWAPDDVHIAPIAIISNNSKWISYNVIVDGNSIQVRDGSGIRINGIIDSSIINNKVYLEKGYTITSTSFVRRSGLYIRDNDQTDKAGYVKDTLIANNHLLDCIIYSVGVWDCSFSSNIVKTTNVFSVDETSIFFLKGFGQNLVSDNIVRVFNDSTTKMGIRLNQAVATGSSPLYDGYFVLDNNMIEQTSGSIETGSTGIIYTPGVSGARIAHVLKNNYIMTFDFGLKDSDFADMIILNNITEGCNNATTDANATTTTKGDYVIVTQ